MKSREYYTLLDTDTWVPKKGDIVAYCPSGTVESNGHTVLSVFGSQTGVMVAFISGRRAHVSIDLLRRDAPERGPL